MPGGKVLSAPFVGCSNVVAKEASGADHGGAYSAEEGTYQVSQQCKHNWCDSLLYCVEVKEGRGMGIERREGEGEEMM
jgi:hypothetical protein